MYLSLNFESEFSVILGLFFVVVLLFFSLPLPSPPINLLTHKSASECWAELHTSNMAVSLNSSVEGPAFSDSDMSADEGSTSTTNQNVGLISLLKQENRVLKMELETCKLRCKSLQEENRALRQASVSIVSISCRYFFLPRPLFYLTLVLDILLNPTVAAQRGLKCFVCDKVRFSLKAFHTT